MQKQKVKSTQCDCENAVANLRAQVAKYGLLMKALRKDRTALQKRDRELALRIIDLDITRREEAERKRA